jgi:hypothetical protein
LLSDELFPLLAEAGVSRRTAERALGPQHLRAGTGHDGFRGPVSRSLPPAGTFVLCEGVEGWPVVTESRYGETRLEHALRHQERVNARRALEVERNRYLRSRRAA